MSCQKDISGKILYLCHILRLLHGSCFDLEKPGHSVVLWIFTSHRGQGLERNDCRLHCRNDLPKYAKIGQLMQNCKSSSKIHRKSRWYQATCAHSQLPALAAETLSASLTWNVKPFIQHLYTVKWRKFDTWHMVIHGSIYTSNPPWSLQRALTGSWRKCHMFFNVSQ